MMIDHKTCPSASLVDVGVGLVALLFIITQLYLRGGSRDSET